MPIVQPDICSSTLFPNSDRRKQAPDVWTFLVVDQHTRLREGKHSTHDELIQNTSKIYFTGYLALKNEMKDKVAVIARPRPHFGGAVYSVAAPNILLIASAL
jgi:hypothetical protein